MLFRGTELDGLIDKKYYLKNSNDAREFGFVYEMDFRENYLFNSNYKSRLGEDVGHKFYSAPMYGMIFNKQWQPSLKEIFQDLADKNNYPMYIHCSHGIDRTGTVTFLLQSILGVDDESKNEQYLYSKYLFKETTLEHMYSIYGGLDAYQGKNTNEKVIDFLKSDVGVTQEEIDSIRNILLESD